MSPFVPSLPRRRRLPAPVALSFLLLALVLAPSTSMAGDRPAPALNGHAFGSPLGDDALETLRGGDRIENKVDLHGTVDGNAAEDIVSGDNSVQGGAFGSAAGINTLIQNTGSNVLIQNGMTVNVQFADPGMP